MESGGNYNRGIQVKEKKRRAVGEAGGMLFKHR